MKSPRFNNYRTLYAKRSGECEKCGTAVKRGDYIAYAYPKHILCRDCYNEWAMEVAIEEEYSRYA